MELAINLWIWLAAIAPVVVLLILLIKYQLGVATAAPFSLIIAVITSFIIFGAPLDLVAGEIAKGIWNGIAVMAVVIPAIVIFEVTSEAGAFEPFRRGMQKFSPNELLQILTVGWVFASFLQGVTGFGVPVAIVAPLLVGMGVKAFWAVTIPLLGHAWATTFGTLAVAWEALVIQTGITGDLLLTTAFWAAIFTWAMDFVAGISICWFYARGEGIKKGLLAVTLISLLHGGGQLILSQFNQVLANFVMSSLGLVLVYFLGRMKAYAVPYQAKNSQMIDRTLSAGQDEEKSLPLTLHEAFVPYYALTVITLFVLLIPPVKSALSFLVIGFGFPKTSTAYNFVNEAVALYAPINVFTHAGVFLILASTIGFFFFKSKGVIGSNGAINILKRTLDKAAPSTIAVILLICMARVMGGSGQILTLAQGTAAATGEYYAIFSPFIGLLGAFMTSSAMASNILFGNFQLTIAELLNFSAAPLLGAQAGGSSIGNIVCPGNVLLGTTTAGILGREGEILKLVIPIGVGVCLFSGVIVYVYQLFV